MQTRFIHDNFILDISHLALSWTEENSWFQDDFFLTSSFPFEIEFEDNLYFEFFQHYNLSNPQVRYQGKLEKNGKIEEAILEVEEASEKLRVTIRYGVEALPNWSKKLHELDLDVVLPDGGSMILHAQTIINKSYPEVNYNFPAVHSKFYDGAQMFNGFEGVINKRVDGHFIENYVDLFNHVILNRNMVYPFPYHLYVLRKVVEDAGYTLHGDVLNDPDLMNKCILSGKKIIEFEAFPAPVEWIVTISDRVSLQNYGMLLLETWESDQEFNFRGKFQFSGEINDEVVWLRITLNGNILFQYQPGNYHFNLFFNTTEENNLLRCEAVSFGNGITGPFVMDSVIRTLELNDEDGNPQLIKADFINVNLATNLPDMTVGEFIKFHKQIKNYDFDLRNNKEIWMNLIQNEVKESKAVDVSEYDVKRPIRRFEQAKSFLLKYEGDFDDYKFDEIYCDQTGYFINDFKKSENVMEISINGVPLPVDTILSPDNSYNPNPDADPSPPSSITTAVQLSDDAAKLMLVEYDGLKDGENWAKESPGLLTLNLFLNHWNNWLNFMLRAVIFTWTIKDDSNLLLKIKKKSKLFAFNNLLFVKTLNRTKKSRKVEEVEIEAYSSKV